MNAQLLRSTVLATSLLTICACQSPTQQTPSHAAEPPAPLSTQAIPTTMDLGVFSLSLSVKDLAVSQDFYSKLGFEQIGGSPEQNYVILRNGQTVIGLFRGMFEGNMLTFNPGWVASLNHPEEYTDIREIEEKVLAAGIEPVTPMSDEARAASGPASFVLVDPDGNPVLFDQHR